MCEGGCGSQMKTLFIGSGEIGVPALLALAASPEHDLLAVVTQPDRPAGRGQRLTGCPVKEAALREHLPIFQPEDVNDPVPLEQLEYFAPDVIVVAAYGQILSQRLLDIPSKGCLNLHASLLPKYRGAACIQRAIRDGERETGLTVMWMDAGLDTGDILLQESTPIRMHDTAGIIHDRLADIAPKVLLKAMDLVATDEAPRIEQDGTLASYAPKLRKEDGRIDWSLTGDELDRHVRAMAPWPSAYTQVCVQDKNAMLKVFSAIPSKRAEGQPGEIISADSQGILVAAATGGLLLREVQLQGKRRMPAGEFLRGNPIEPGTVLS